MWLFTDWKADWEEARPRASLQKHRPKHEKYRLFRHRKITNQSPSRIPVFAQNFAFLLLFQNFRITFAPQPNPRNFPTLLPLLPTNPKLYRNNEKFTSQNATFA